jgi:hypothetical protein
MGGTVSAGIVGINGNVADDYVQGVRLTLSQIASEFDFEYRLTLSLFHDSF